MMDRRVTVLGFAVAAWATAGFRCPGPEPTTLPPERVGQGGAGGRSVSSVGGAMNTTGGGGMVSVNNSTATGVGGMSVDRCAVACDGIACDGNCYEHCTVKGSMCGIVSDEHVIDCYLDEPNCSYTAIEACINHPCDTQAHCGISCSGILTSNCAMDNNLGQCVDACMAATLDCDLAVQEELSVCLNEQMCGMAVLVDDCVGATACLMGDPAPFEWPSPTRR